jgi:hypothetical protein
MNVHAPPSLETALPCTSVERAKIHEVIGALVEKCAQAEGHLLALLRLYDAEGAKHPKTTLSCKITALRSAAAGKPDTKARKLLKLLKELEPLADLRSELAHSTFTIVPLSEPPLILFKNAAESDVWIDRRMVITLERLIKAKSELSRVANGLKQLAGA